MSYPESSPADLANAYLDYNEQLLKKACGSNVDPRAKEQALLFVEQLRARLNGDQRVDLLISNAISLGSAMTFAFRGDRIRAWKALKARQRQGGQSKRRIDPAHRAEIESKATTLRLQHPEWKLKKKPLCEALAHWYSESLLSQDSVGWQSMRLFMEPYFVSRYEKSAGEQEK